MAGSSGQSIELESVVLEEKILFQNLKFDLELIAETSE